MDLIHLDNHLGSLILSVFEGDMLKIGIFGNLALYMFESRLSLAKIPIKSGSFHFVSTFVSTTLQFGEVIVYLLICFCALLIECMAVYIF